MIIKRRIKWGAGRVSVLAQLVGGRPSRRQGCILMYHRVGDVGFVDPEYDDYNVPPETFDRQIAALADFAELVPLVELPGRLARSSNQQRPLVALTFDDGYANFFTGALPILRRYGAPATVFVVTSAVGQDGPVAFDGWSRKNADRVPREAVRSMTWAELEGCLDTGLVGIGSHSHSHHPGTVLSDDQAREEAARSREALKHRLGDGQGNEYAYPYGRTRLGFVTPQYVQAVKSAGYELAVSSDVGLAKPGSDPYSLPRVEAHALDTPSALGAKARGSLALFHLVDWIRRKPF